MLWYYVNIKRDKLEIDFGFDYSKDIKKDVDYVVSASTSLQKEVENIEKILAEQRNWIAITKSRVCRRKQQYVSSPSEFLLGGDYQA